MNLLGSSVIQNLGFRDIWYFIGQKGIKGYSEFEEVWYIGYQKLEGVYKCDMFYIINGFYL